MNWIRTRGLLNRISQGIEIAERFNPSKKKRKRVLAGRIAAGRPATSEAAGIRARFHQTCVTGLACLGARVQTGEGAGLNCPFAWVLRTCGFWPQGESVAAR
jgi:hypothetical protein